MHSPEPAKPTTEPFLQHHRAITCHGSGIHRVIVTHMMHESIALVLGHLFGRRGGMKKSLHSCLLHCLGKQGFNCNETTATACIRSGTQYTKMDQYNAICNLHMVITMATKLFPLLIIEFSYRLFSNHHPCPLLI